MTKPLNRHHQRHGKGGKPDPGANPPIYGQPIVPESQRLSGREGSPPSGVSRGVQGDGYPPSGGTEKRAGGSGPLFVEQVGFRNTVWRDRFRHQLLTVADQTGQ